jgi:hypothetical protein
MHDKPHRRWFRFSLKTVLVVMTLASIALAWARFSLDWIHERQTAEFADFGGDQFVDASKLPRAPGGLWLFGEKGRGQVVCRNASDLERYSRLFPEAKVTDDRIRYYDLPSNR